MFLSKARKIIGWTVTIVYGGCLLMTTIYEAKQLIDDMRLYKDAKRTYQKKPGEEFIETFFTD